MLSLQDLLLNTGHYVLFNRVHMQLQLEIFANLKKTQTS